MEKYIMVFISFSLLVFLIAGLYSMKNVQDSQIEKCTKMGGEYFHVHGGGNCVIPR